MAARSKARASNLGLTIHQPLPGSGTDDRGGLTKFNGRNLLKDRAYEKIKEFILQGAWTPQVFVAERQLAERLSMSKTPIRAALERLQAEGFVTISPQQGILVREPSIHEIADQYEIRIALESYIVRALAGRLSLDQRQQVENHLAAMAAQEPATDPLTFVRIDTEYHLLFCRLLNNQEISQVMLRLREKIQRVATTVFRMHPMRMSNSLAEHREIAEAVLHGDGGLAAKLMESHLEYGKQCLLSPRRETV